jgi:DNA-binding CsgD family transcriptional regulator
VQDDRTQDVYVSATAGLSVIRGWTAVASHMESVFQNDLSCQKTQFRQENHQISVDRNTAWVVFDGWSEDSSGASQLNFETRILERHSGTWKIVYSSVMARHGNGYANTEISVDKAGQVIWASSGSLEKLKDHPVLTISAGRVRAHRRDWDKELQKEIAKAGKYHGFFELHKFSTDTGGSLQYPAVLGDTSDGGLAVVLISVRDCVTLLRLDGDEVVEHRLAVAQAVYGLSGGQMRIAARIAAGDGLKKAAATLGISINTARTHLSRIFEKTGVNSQTALVRLLLSVG